MNIVIDASSILAVLLNERQKLRITELTKGSVLIAPEILPYEIGNALIALERRKKISREQVSAIFLLFNKIAVRLLPANIHEAIKMASVNEIYAYDAYYLELAQRLKLPLLTLDGRMQCTGKNLNIQIPEI